jgi:hypothetical protein
MPSLTQTTHLKLAPLFLQTLVRHYYSKVVKDANSPRVPLRDEELLYDEVFFIAKASNTLTWSRDLLTLALLLLVLYAAIHARCDNVRLSVTDSASQLIDVKGTQSRNSRTLPRRGLRLHSGETSSAH